MAARSDGAALEVMTEIPGGGEIRVGGLVAEVMMTKPAGNGNNFYRRTTKMRIGQFGLRL